MKFALLLLGILVIVCTAGSVIPQGQAESVYLSSYSEGVGKLILALQLDDVFHCTWFVILTIVLCLNLLGCNLTHFPKLMKRTREGFTPERFLVHTRGEALLESGDPETLFAKCGFRNLQESEIRTGEKYLYGVKNKPGIWGAWLTHLGMLIVIVGFGLGQMLQLQYVVYGVPGQTKTIGDTQYDLTIDDFVIGLREDDTVDQYTATLTVTDHTTGETHSGETSVNNPLSLFGMKFYQNSTGWAADVQVYKDEELVQEEVICAGENLKIADKEGLTVWFSAFYPDYIEGPDGAPATMSGRLNNPAYLYRLTYQNNILGMNILKGKEVITVDAYTIVFANPQSYTLIQIKKDPFTKLTAVGALLIMFALLLAFYCRTAQVGAIQNADGSWRVYGHSRKGGLEFVESLKNRHMEIDECIRKES